MALKQLKEEFRIIFLKKFTQELVLSFLEEKRIERKIEIERLRREFIEPQISPEQAFRKIIKTPVVPIENISEKKESKTFEKNLPTYHLVRKPIFKKSLNGLVLRKAGLKFREQPSFIYPNEPLPLQTFELELEQKPEGFNLRKVDLLLKDPLIKMIECEGPDKELTVKKNGRTFKTKIIMSQKEIKEVLDSFSKEAKIPIIGGIFKVVVGDLIIFALVSEVVGSKFIITRISPYSLLKQN